MKHIMHPLLDARTLWARVEIGSVLRMSPDRRRAAVGGRRSVVDAGALSGRHSGREVS